MISGKLTCFKTYDIRGIIGDEINEEIYYRVARAFGVFFCANTVVVGRDARASSPSLANAIKKGLMDEGIKVLDLGLSGTEEMYWATTNYKACGGLQVTASHNPIEYNGLKLIKSESRPLNSNTELLEIKKIAENNAFKEKKIGGELKDVSFEAKNAYVKKVLSFLSSESKSKLKIVVNSGNGAAGPTFDAIAKKLLARFPNFQFIRVDHIPDSSFPNGIPNPMLKNNHAYNKKIILSERADLGVAFDGDFDRCFFFDEKGSFISGEYILGLLAESFLKKNPSSKIVHDVRLVWNAEDIIKNNEGISVKSKTGHAFIKDIMRKENAVYGGEISAHHYFKEFSYCDSGMIPMLLILELICSTGKNISQLVEEREMRFPSSGEKNYKVKDPSLSIKKVFNYYKAAALKYDFVDGISLCFEDWRFNLRESNTENVLRLNIESIANVEIIRKKEEEIENIIDDKAGISAVK